MGRPGAEAGGWAGRGRTRVQADGLVGPAGSPLRGARRTRRPRSAWPKARGRPGAGARAGGWDPGAGAGTPGPYSLTVAVERMSG